MILSDVEPEKSGAASGANSTVRMIGNSLGVAIMSALLSVFTIRHAVDGVRTAPGLSDDVQRARPHPHPSRWRQLPAAGAGRHRTSSPSWRSTLGDAIATAARTPLFAATGFVTVGLLISFLIPPVGPPAGAGADELVEEEHEAELMAEAVALH